MLGHPNTKQNWTILSSLYDAAKQKALKKLRLAKCSECGRATPYKLKSLQITTVPCKRCGTSIPITVSIINKPPNEITKEFLRTVEKLPKRHLHVVRQIRLIKGSGRLGLNKVVGGYDHRTGVITIYSKAPELAKTVFHEVAHNIYRDRDIFSQGEKQSWELLWNEKVEHMPSEYAKWSSEEGFAECYGHLHTNPERVEPFIQTWFRDHYLLD